ncbi:uncharacterized protein LOC142972970 [Anticarsia gemmatalis]|uniref:uncharacterized protein LOC142972970 n=1 Tax=Anticarsia gemmatalis TaxID=129554 RepID=UPI003F770700
MKTITFIALALTAVNFCQADDDGQYRPEHYSDVRSRQANNAYYRSLAERNGKYGSIYNAYRPFYYQALNRELLSPLQVSYGDSFDQATFPTPVTYSSTPVVPVSTFRPIVYSTPKPFAKSVYSTSRPVYSTPKPVYSTPRPYSVSQSPSAIYLKSVTDSAANIVRDDRTYDENNYHFAYETDNGIAAEESGVVDTSVNGVGGGTKVRGFYEYIGDDGHKYRVDYVADENGYRASGAHLPKAP